MYMLQFYNVSSQAVCSFSFETFNNWPKHSYNSLTLTSYLTFWDLHGLGHSLCNKNSMPKVCCDWREIALTMRDKVFEEHEEQLIDIHDVKVHFCVLV